MKLMASGVTRSAAMVRSPSFSRSSSSTTMTILPSRICSSACSTEMWGGHPVQPHGARPPASLRQAIVQQAGDVFRQQVGLQVDRVARVQAAQVGDRQGVRDQRHREAARAHLVHGQADAVDGDRALGGDVGRHLGAGPAAPASGRRPPGGWPAPCRRRRRGRPPGGRPADRPCAAGAPGGPGRPARRRPKVVQASVSGPRSAWKRRPRRDTAVRQTPSTAIEPPWGTVVRSRADEITTRRFPRSGGPSVSIVPVVSMMPVNIQARRRGTPTRRPGLHLGAQKYITRQRLDL